MAAIEAFHQHSIDNPDAFWADEALLIDWHKPFSKTLDFSRPPFAKWFVGGETNLCYNAVDRHAAKRPNDRAMVFISTETDTEIVYSFAQLKAEVMEVLWDRPLQKLQMGPFMIFFLMKEFLHINPT